MGENSSENRPINPKVPKKDVQPNSYPLPEGFEWYNLDLNQESDLQDLYNLLYENYVEDDDNMFRFDYSKEFLKWALMPPGFQQFWHCGIRTKARKIVGFIAAIPVEMFVIDQVIRMVEINFLCVLKQYRNKKMAPVLIKEITRRVNYQGIFQAMYTSGTLLPRPVSVCRYWHRPLNFPKLVDVKFSQLKPNMTIKRSVKLYSLPTDKELGSGYKIKPMNKAHSKEVRNMLNAYLSKNFQIYPKFSQAEIEHWLLPKKDVISSYIIVNSENEVTDFCSFYSLSSTVVNHPVHKSLRAAYSFYNFSTVTPLKELIEIALIKAKELDYDVFNILDLMNNSAFLEELKFGIGDGNLNYYIYNWLSPLVPKNKLGLVLL